MSLDKQTLLPCPPNLGDNNGDLVLKPRPASPTRSAEEPDPFDIMLEHIQAYDAGQFDDPYDALKAVCDAVESFRPQLEASQAKPQSDAGVTLGADVQSIIAAWRDADPKWFEGGYVGTLQKSLQTVAAYAALSRQAAPVPTSGAVEVVERISTEAYQHGKFYKHKASAIIQTALNAEHTKGQRAYDAVVRIWKDHCATLTQPPSADAKLEALELFALMEDECLDLTAENQSDETGEHEGCWFVHQRFTGGQNKFLAVGDTALEAMQNAAKALAEQAAPVKEGV